jgi:hypothetical protein
MEQKKEAYTEPTVVAHDMLRDITAVASGKAVGEKTGLEVIK